MTYQTEFPGFEDAPDADWLQAHGFEDISWRNDTCPSFMCDVFVLWVDFKDPAMREHPETPRYAITDEGREVLATDDWAAVRAFVEDGVR
jgi:hypothetical protein